MGFALKYDLWHTVVFCCLLRFALVTERLVSHKLLLCGGCPGAERCFAASFVLWGCSSTGRVHL